MRQGESDQLSSDFQSWQKAAEQFRENKEDLNWLFLGAKKSLHDSEMNSKNKELLISMIEAMENNTRPLPAWPGLEASIPSKQN